MTLTLVQFEYAWEISAYLRAAGIYYEEENCNFFSTRTASFLPYLKDERYIIEGDRVLSYLKDNYRDIDLDFSEAERAEIDLFTYFLHTVGEITLNRRLWLKAGEREKALAAVYRPAVGVFYSLLYSSANRWVFWRQSRRFSQVTSLTESELAEKLEALYALLNARLAARGEACYLYGDRPSSLDVALFAHLAQIRQFPDTLMHLVDRQPQLMRLYERFLTDFFAPADDSAALSTNQFLRLQHIRIERANEKLCYTTRKTSYNKSDDVERDKMLDAMEEEDKKLFKWRIASFIGTIIVGSATIILLDRVTNSNRSFIPSFKDSSQ